MRKWVEKVRQTPTKTTVQVQLPDIELITNSTKDAYDYLAKEGFIPTNKNNTPVVEFNENKREVTFQADDPQSAVAVARLSTLTAATAINTTANILQQLPVPSDITQAFIEPMRKASESLYKIATTENVSPSEEIQAAKKNIQKIKKELTSPKTKIMLFLICRFNSNHPARKIHENALMTVAVAEQAIQYAENAAKAMSTPAAQRTAPLKIKEKPAEEIVQSASDKQGWRAENKTTDTKTPSPQQGMKRKREESNEDKTPARKHQKQNENLRHADTILHAIRDGATEEKLNALIDKTNFGNMSGRELYDVINKALTTKQPDSVIKHLFDIADKKVDINTDDLKAMFIDAINHKRLPLIIDQVEALLTKPFPHAIPVGPMGTEKGSFSIPINSALHHAAKAGDIEMVNAICKIKFDPKSVLTSLAPDAFVTSDVIMVAATGKKWEVVERMLAMTDDNKPNNRSLEKIKGMTDMPEALKTKIDGCLTARKEEQTETHSVKPHHQALSSIIQAPKPPDEEATSALNYKQPSP
ncbi:MAG: hypothetical protein NTZ67_01735 [Gammaproteobacteria bacterium]|nr:hypothetical protein [Gammaproteobacteria bacterium]